MAQSRTLVAKLSNLLSANEDGKIFDKLYITKAKEDTPPKTSNAAVYFFRGISIVGVQIPHNYKLAYLLWSISINLISTTYLPFGFVLSFVYHISEFSPSQFLTSLQVAINCWGCSMKLIVMVFMKHHLRTAEIYMDKLDARLTDKFEQDKIRKVVAFGNRVFMLFTASYWSYAFCTFISSVFSGRPPYQIYNPMMEWRDGQRQLILQALMEYLLMTFTCFQEVILDSYPVIYINIIRTHLQILARRIIKLGEDKSLNDDQRFNQLVQCVLDHKTLLDMFNHISPVISVTIFIQFLIMGIILGFTMINIFLFANISGIIASFLYLVAVLLETFPLCYYANCLMDDSDEIALSIFHSQWVMEDQRYKKIVAFFLQHTQQTLVLTAMKLFPITMNSNLNLAKFAFSVYTLMKQFDFGKHFKNEQEEHVSDK